MLEKQSLEEFLSNLTKGKAVIVSLSPQSRASLAVHYGLSSLQVRSYIKTMWFWQYGIHFHHVQYMEWWFPTMYLYFLTLPILNNFQVLTKLTTFFKSLGVKAVFDTSSSRDLTLIESCNEFITRYKQSNSTNDVKSKSAFPMISSACPGIHLPFCNN